MKKHIPFLQHFNPNNSCQQHKFYSTSILHLQYIHIMLFIQLYTYTIRVAKSANGNKHANFTGSSILSNTTNNIINVRSLRV